MKTTKKGKGVFSGERNLNGAPRKEFSEKDFEKIDNMIFIQCTAEEVASVMEVDADTLNARLVERYGYSFSERFKLKSGGGRMSLRRRQFRKAIDEGDTRMLIHLGKQYLGQSDKVETLNETELSSKCLKVEFIGEEVKSDE